MATQTVNGGGAAFGSHHRTGRQGTHEQLDADTVMRQVVGGASRLVDDLMRQSGRTELPPGLDKALVRLANDIAEVTLRWIGDLS